MDPKQWRNKITKNGMKCFTPSQRTYTKKTLEKHGVIVAINAIPQYHVKLLKLAGIVSQMILNAEPDRKKIHSDVTFHGIPGNYDIYNVNRKSFLENW